MLERISLLNKVLSMLRAIDSQADIDELKSLLGDTVIPVALIRYPHTPLVTQTEWLEQVLEGRYDDQ